MLHGLVADIFSVVSPQEIFINFAKFLLFLSPFVFMSCTNIIINADITHQLRYWRVNKRSIYRRFLSLLSKIISKGWSIEMHFLRYSISFCVKQTCVWKLIRVKISWSWHLLLGWLYRIAWSLNHRRLRSHNPIFFWHLLINFSCLISSLTLIDFILSSDINLIINDRLKSIPSFKQIIRRPATK